MTAAWIDADSACTVCEGSTDHSPDEFRDLDALLEYSADPVLLVRADGRIARTNRLLTALLGYTEAELVGRRIEMLVPTEYRAGHARARDEFVRAGRPRPMATAKPLSALHRDGTRIPVEISLLPIERRDGRLVSCALRDVRERSRAERILASVVDGTARETGDRFMHVLVQSLAGALGVRFAFVVEFLGSKLERARVLSLWTGTGHLPPFEYPLAGTPCEEAGTRGEVVVHSGVADRFPRATFLRRLGMDSFFAVRLHDRDGRPLGLLVTGDSTPLRDEAIARTVLRIFGARVGGELERLHAVRDLRASEQLFRATFEQAAVGISQTSPDGRWLSFNQRLCDILGYAREELREMTVTAITYPEDVERERVLRARMLSGEQSTYTLKKRCIQKSGRLVWVMVTVSLVRRDDGAPDYAIAIVEDISAQVRYEEQLEHNARHDPLTGLPNRLLLADRIHSAIATARRNQSRSAILYLDLDHFKRVNDSLGHHVGDEVVVAVARRLVGVLREVDTVARVGGDEFVIVLPNLAAAVDAGTVAEKIGAAVAQPLRIGSNEFVLSTSIGIAVYPDDGSDDVTLLRNADTALYRAKENGRDCFRFFAGEMNVEVRARLELERDMRLAIDADEFTLAYQPIVALGSGRVVGAEALLRWRRADGSPVPPSSFIPVAEESGLIGKLGRRALFQATQAAARWNAEAAEPVFVSVNLSGRQFRDAHLVDMVGEAVRAAGIPSAALKLEITETTVMHNAEEAIRTLGALNAIGVALSVDDFGTGYSSLSYLKRFPIRTLKIDRSFVRDLASDPDDLAICRSIIELGHALGLEVVAEGVETAEQRRILEANGCDLAQGFLFSKPVPEEELRRLLSGPPAGPDDAR